MHYISFEYYGELNQKAQRTKRTTRGNIFYDEGTVAKQLFCDSPFEMHLFILPYLRPPV